MNTLFTKAFRRLKRAAGIDAESLSKREHLRENARDVESGHNSISYVNMAIDRFKNMGGSFNGFALTESSMRSFFYNLLQINSPEYTIVELGGGQSTLFLIEISKYVNIKVFTYEHDPGWAKFLQEKVANNKNMQVFNLPIKQIDDNYRSDMFNSPQRSNEIWGKFSNYVPKELYKNLVLKNSFYEIKSNNLPEHNVDGLIVDGPHGNGRSICFPLLHNIIKNGTIVLMDDYHHYPFLDDMGKIFTYEIIEKRKYKHSNKGWVVVKVLYANNH